MQEPHYGGKTPEARCLGAVSSEGASPPGQSGIRREVKRTLFPASAPAPRPSPSCPSCPPALCPLRWPAFPLPSAGSFAVFLAKTFFSKYFFFKLFIDLFLAVLSSLQLGLFSGCLCGLLTGGLLFLAPCSRMNGPQQLWPTGPPAHAQELWPSGLVAPPGLWDLLRPGSEPMSPALAGRFFATTLLGKILGGALALLLDLITSPAWRTAIWDTPQSWWGQRPWLLVMKVSPSCFPTGVLSSGKQMRQPWNPLEYIFFK